MQQAGVEGQQVVLLLEDHQFLQPQFLELINSLLSSGEIPGLYTPEELEPLLAPIRDQASDEGFRGTLISYYASRECYVSRNFYYIIFRIPEYAWFEEKNYLLIKYLSLFCPTGQSSKCSMCIMYSLCQFLIGSH